MSLLDVGRMCIKKTGREAGKQCVVVDIIDKNFVLVTGPKDLTGVRRRRVNVDHLAPTEQKIPLKRGADDETVLKALKKNVEEVAPKKREKPSRKKREAEVPPAAETGEEAGVE